MDDLKARARVMLDALPQFDDEASKNITTDDLVCTIVKALAEVRAETEARVVEAAAQVVEAHVVGGRAWTEEQAQAAKMLFDVAAAVRSLTLAPADYVAVRREDFAVIAEAAEEQAIEEDTCANRCMSMQAKQRKYHESEAEKIRAALSRARKGE